MTAFLALWPLLKRFWFVPVLGAALLYAMIERGNARHWHKLYDAEKAAHAQTVANYRAASAQAQADAHAAKIATEARQDAITEKVNHDAQIAIDDAQRRADAFIAAHRVRAPQADPGSSGKAGMPEPANATESSDRSGEVAVMADDVRICTENTTRLKAVNAWAAAVEGQK